MSAADIPLPCREKGLKSRVASLIRRGLRWTARILFALGALLPAPAGGLVFSAPLAPFGSGQILQQVQPLLPPPPQIPLPPLPHKKGPGKNRSGTIRVRVTRFRIVGNSTFPAPVLQTLLRDLEGHRLSFRQISEAAARITTWYRVHGYPLSRAVLPKQTIDHGVVTIRVIESRVGKVRLHNASRVRNSLLAATLSGVPEGKILSSSALESDLLLLSDIPGTHVVSTLSPGTVTGTTDLDVDVLDAPMVSGTLSVDDYGDPYTGSLRQNGTGNVNNLLHAGDLLTIDATTAYSGFNYGHLSYDALIDGAGTRIGAGYSALDYRLGGGVSLIGYNPNANTILSLGANGYAQTISGWITQPLLRSPDRNVSLRLSYDRYILSDTYSQTTGAANNRSLDVFSATLTGDETDAVLGGGRVNATISYAPYTLTLGAGNQANNPYASSTPGFRSVWRALLSRTQTLPGNNNALFLSGNGQSATGTLDPSMQYVLGGPQSVRSYSTAVLFGDEGYTATADLQHTWSWTALPGSFQSSLFFDAGGVTYGNTFLTLTGPGAGEAWQAPYGWFSKIELSTPVGSIPSVVGSTSPVQVWFEAVKSF